MLDVEEAERKKIVAGVSAQCRGLHRGMLELCEYEFLPAALRALGRVENDHVFTRNSDFGIDQIHCTQQERILGRHDQPSVVFARGPKKDLQTFDVPWPEVGTRKLPIDVRENLPDVPGNVLFAGNLLGGLRNVRALHEEDVGTRRPGRLHKVCGFLALETVHADVAWINTSALFALYNKAYRALHRVVDRVRASAKLREVCTKFADLQPF